VVFADEPVDLQVIHKIKKEGFENSKVMEIASYLTDVYGPRLTGSPNLKKASEWARDKLTEWGLENARLESWGTFGKGWSVERFSIEMLEPHYMNIIGYPKAWTTGTDGVVSGQPILISLDEEDPGQYKGKLKNKIILLGDPREADPHFEADASRYTEGELAELTLAPEVAGESSRKERSRKYREERAKRKKISAVLIEEEAAVILESSSIDHGTLRVGRGGSYKLDEPEDLPAMIITKEQYNRIARIMEKGIAVQLEINIKNQFHREDSLGYNVVAEIPGSDSKLKEELVMLGAHFDSWHAGTGAVDNAAGSAVMMEAVRILKAIGVKPRRTIRIALWSGEEQGILGSENYVAKHFGNPETGDIKPEYANFSAYFNIDNGSGKIRGIYLQSNDAVRPVFEAYLKPFHDLGATTVTIRNTRGTDHLSFDAAGLPGFQFIQDPLAYSSRNWHTNMDVYDHLQENDLKQMAVIVASFVYHTAMRDEKIPRKPLAGKE
jgi:hypothetical protein